jgi:hypothetical protein
MKNQSLEESDWKHLRNITPACRERYLGEVNLRMAGILTGEGTDSATERFWKVEEEFEKEAVNLRQCLDDQRRSNAVRKAASMYFTESSKMMILRASQKSLWIESS